MHTFFVFLTDKLSPSAVSLQGKTASPSNKQNQDSYFIIDQLEGCEGVALFGVFDGHGDFFLFK